MRQTAINYSHRKLISLIPKELKTNMFKRISIDTPSLSLSSEASVCVGQIFLIHGVTEQPPVRDSSFCPRRLVYIT